MSERRIEPGRAIREAFAIYSEDAGALITFAAVIFLPVAFLGGLFADSGAVTGLVLTALLSGPATLVYHGTVAPTVVAARRGEPKPHPGDVLDFVQKVAGPLAVAGLLWILAVSLGMLALIVPGLILLTIWAVVGPAIALERREIMLAFKRSRELVRGNGWQVFLAIAGLVVLLALASALFQSLGAALAGTPGAFIGGWVATVLAAPPPALLATVLFLDLGGSPEPAEEEEEPREREAEEKREEEEREEGDRPPPVQ